MERRQDIVLGFIFVLLGIAAAWMATSYAGAGGIYPMILGLVLTLLGGTVTARAFVSGTQTSRKLFDAPAKMVTAVAAGAAYVALVVPLGFYTSSFLLMLVLPALLGFRQWLYALIVALVFMGVVFLVFSILLEKPLPREALLTLLGQGG